MALSRCVRTLPFGVVCLVLSLSGPTDAQKLERARQPKIHPHMKRLLDERGPIKGWVYFGDKNLADAAAVRAALDRAEAALGERQRHRRELRRRRAGLVDWYDVPVDPG